MRYHYKTIRALRRVVALVSIFALMHGTAWAGDTLPSGGRYVAGHGTIATSNGSMVVDQTTNRGVIDWKGFSIGAGNSVQFNNGSGATLNRVTGGSLSAIEGNLSATGSVYVINPQGVVIGPGGKVVTNGSFVASTREVSANTFMNGGALSAHGTSAGDIANQGSIASANGDVVLFGRNVSNSGTISAPNGTAGLASGNNLLLRPAGGDPRIAVSAGSGSVTQSGSIAAAQAELAAANGNVYAIAGSGAVSATGTAVRNGHVWLTAGGGVQVSGAVAAKNADGSGGTIVVAGHDVNIGATAAISANGTQGGTILIGGDQAGGSDPAAKRVAVPVARARTTTVEAGARLSADADTAGAGSGGAVVVWSDVHTDFEGALSARGGAAGGDGGFAEVSSHGMLDFLGATDLSAAHGAVGDLLLDPHNVTIVSGTGGTITTGSYAAPADDSQLGATTLASALASANVTVTTGSSGTQAGNITVNAAVNWTGNHSLTLTSGTGGAIAVNAAITATGTAGNTKTITLNGGTGGITTAAAITTTYNGTGTGITLSTTGAVTVGGALTANSTGSTGTGVAIVAPGGIAINGAISTTNATVSLKAGDNSNTAATVTEGVGGSITASKLRLWSAATAQANSGSFTLGSTSNAIATLAASVANLAFTNDKALAVGTVTTTGITVAGDSSLTTTVGAITQSNALTWSTANTFTLNSAAGITLSAAVTGTSGTLVLKPNGAVTQSATAANAIKVDSLALLGSTSSSVTLTNTSNKVNTLAINTGSVTFQDSSALTIGGAGGQSGIVAAGAVTIGDTGGITVAQDITETGTGAITITADTGHTGTGTITWSGTRAFASNAAITTFANGYSGSTPAFSGSGSFNPYTTISTLAGLQNIANDLSGSYALMADINATGVAFTPIGTGADPFTGAFDGQGHVISNLTIADTSGNAAGLFGAIGASASIKNIGIVSGAISGAGPTGAIVGENQGGAINNVFSFASVTSSGGAAGGLVGHMQGGTITTAFATGDVNGITAGGLIGAFDGGAVGQTYASGAVSGTTAGGLYGTLGGGTTTASYFDTTINPALAATASGGISGGSGLTSAQFTATSNFAGWTFGTTAGAAGWVIVDTDSTLNNAGGAAGGTRPMFLTSAASGSGTLTITNGLQLQLVALRLSGNYNLGGNIDMNDVGITKASGLWLGQGFVPLGSATSDPTSTPAAITYATTHAYTGGTFDGKTFAISNLYINRPNQDFVGLFGYTDGAVIQNLTVSGNVTGRDFTGGIVGDASYQPSFNTTTDIESTNAAVNVTGRDYTGGMIGYADDGTINNFFTHTMGSSGNVSGRNYVGGFIGYMNDASGVPIENIFATGNVSGNDYVGGLVGALYGTMWTNGAGWQTYASGNVSGHDYVGGYAGFTSGQIAPQGGAAYATGSVTGNDNVGGFTGYVDYGADITQAFATGNVSGVMNVGGFVGNNGSATTNESNLTDVFAEGSVSGVTNVGGFAGYNLNGIFDAYATGAVNGATNVGGFVGLNDSQLQVSPDGSFTSYVAFGHIVAGYATGDVRGTTNTGGFAGGNGADTSGNNKPATISGVWFDTTTSGLSQGVGAANGTTTTIQGASTATLTAMSLSGYGFSSSDWAAGGAFPVLKFLYPSGADTFWGSVQSGIDTGGGTSVVAGARVEARISGLSGTALAAAAGVGASGADGNFWINLPTGTIAATHDYLFSTSDGVTFVHDQTGSVDRTITAGALTDVQAADESTALSALSADAAMLTGSDAALASLLSTRANRVVEVDNGATLDIDQALSTGTLLIADPSFGTITQSRSISANLLVMASLTGTTTLTDSGNTVGQVQGDLGALSLYTSGPLTVGASGVDNTGDGGNLTLRSGGDLTLASDILLDPNETLVLATAGHFINGVTGSQAVGEGAGSRWIVYSADPDGDTFGTSMDSQQTAIWGATYDTAAPGTIPAGNNYVFANTPTLTLAAGDIHKTYGDDASNALAGYTATGLESGVANAFLGDRVGDILDGTPVLMSDGAAVTALVSGSPYAVTLASGSASALHGYTLAVSGTITVDPKTLTITAHDNAKTYGDTPDLGHTAFDADGLVNGDTVAAVDLSSAGAAATATVGDGPYAIVASNASGLGLDNYTISYVSGALTVDPKALTITAQSAHKTYGDTATLSFDTDGLINGDTVTSADVESTGAVATAGVSGSPYAVTVGSAFGTGLDNYTIGYASGALTVDPRALTVTIHDADKTYGNTMVFDGKAFDTDGLVNGDAVTSVNMMSTGALAGTGAGQYAITGNGMHGTGLSNYAVSYANGTLTVDPRTLTITIGDLDKAQGAPMIFNGANFSASGLVNGDTIRAVNMTSAGATATAAQGQYAITGSGAHGTGLGNYTLVFVNGTLSVDPQAVSNAIRQASYVDDDTSNAQ